MTQQRPVKYDKDWRWIWQEKPMKINTTKTKQKGAHQR